MAQSSNYALVWEMSQRNIAIEGLKNLSSTELDRRVKEHFSKTDRESFNPDTLLFNNYSSPYYQTLASLDILRERHGDDYVARLTGFRPPKTFWEKVVNFLTNRPIPLEQGHQYELGLKFS